MTENNSLYQRLGGYDGITGFVENLLARLYADPQLGHYWANVGEKRTDRAKHLLIEFLCAQMGGPQKYTGRDMKIAHQGMHISPSDWQVFFTHAAATLHALQVPEQEAGEIVAMVSSLESAIVSKS